MMAASSDGSVGLIAVGSTDTKASAARISRSKQTHCMRCFEGSERTVLTVFSGVYAVVLMNRNVKLKKTHDYYESCVLIRKNYLTQIPDLIGSGVNPNGHCKGALLLTPEHFPDIGVEPTGQVGLPIQRPFDKAV